MKPAKLQNKYFAQILTLGLFFGCLAVLFVCDNDDKLPVAPTETPKPGDYEVSVKVDKLTRWFKLVIPSKYDHTSPRPLVLCFHGGNLSMGFVFNDRKDLIARCDAENWILAIPNGCDFNDNRGASTWNAIHCCDPAMSAAVNDIGFVQKVVDTLSVYLKIDPARIYAMGGSNGAMLTHRLAAEMPDIFAAVALSAGTIGGQAGLIKPLETIQPTQPVPIMMVHGINDVNVNYYGGKTADNNRIDISFSESVTFRAQNNQCTVGQQDTTIVNGLKGSIWIVIFKDCYANKEVRGVTIENHGHGWPGLEEAGWDGTKAMVDFLKRFSK